MKLSQDVPYSQQCSRWEINISITSEICYNSKYLKNRVMSVIMELPKSIGNHYVQRLILKQPETLGSLK